MGTVRAPEGWLSIVESISHVLKKDLWVCSEGCARNVLAGAIKRAVKNDLSAPRGPFRFDDEGRGSLVEVELR